MQTAGLELASHSLLLSHRVSAKVVGQHMEPLLTVLSPLATSLLKVHLQLHGFSVFIDVEKLEAGKFEDKLLQSVLSARNFVLVLSPNALDKCMEDPECKDWVHKVRDATRWELCGLWSGRELVMG